jgi:hypothetical protein
VVQVQEYCETHPTCLTGTGPHIHRGYRYNAISALVCDRLIAQLMQTGTPNKGSGGKGMGGKGKAVSSVFSSTSLPATTVYAILCDMKASQWRLLVYMSSCIDGTMLVARQTQTQTVGARDVTEVTEAAGVETAFHVFPPIDMEQVRSMRQLPPISTPQVGPTGAEGGKGVGGEGREMEGGEAEVGVALHTLHALQQQQNLDEELQFEERVGQLLKRVGEVEASMYMSSCIDGTMHVSATACAGPTLSRLSVEGEAKKQRVA